MEQITKETGIKKLLAEHPEAAEILMAYGLQCVNCYFSEFDTIENGAQIHGMSSEDIEMMVKDLNTTIRKKENDNPSKNN